MQLARTPRVGLATASLLMAASCGGGDGTTTSGPPSGNYCGAPVAGDRVIDISQMDATTTAGSGFPLIVVLSE